MVGEAFLGLSMLQISGVKARLLSGVSVRALAVVLGGSLGAAFAFQRLGVNPNPRTLEAPRPPRLAPPAPDLQVVCAARAAELARAPAEPLPVVDTPELRAQLLGRAKSVPVFFSSTPPVDETSAVAEGLRKKLELSPGYATFDRVVGQVRKDPALARAVFLRDGYLYVELPELASLYAALTLSLLFRDPELLIQRGAEELGARRLEDGDYEYTTGDERGRRAKLLLFDRVTSASAPFEGARHVDLRPLRRQLGFDEVRVLHAAAGALSVQLVYGASRTPAVLRVEGLTAKLECEALGAERAAVMAARAEAARAEHAQERLLSVMVEQVDEGLPFDEPKTEEGQQDGKLRPEWRTAYLNGRSSFEFNGDRYAVFDGAGRPRPPQVCIDFVIDTFERAGGSWWQSREMPRARPRGRLLFDDTRLENRRSVESFIGFARAHREAFDVYEPPPDARVPLRNREQFFGRLYRERHHYRRGDIVAILGPRDDEKLHYHSFIIVAADPLSGMPIELAANAGRPRIRSWEGEMSNAPRRSIFARVRPRQVWLDSFLAPETGATADDPQTDVNPSRSRPAAG